MTRDGLSTWIDRRPLMAIGALVGAPLLLGIVLAGAFSRSLRVMRAVAWPIVAVAVLFAAVAFVAIWLVPRVRTRPRWATAFRRVAWISAIAFWTAFAFGNWRWSDDPYQSSFNGLWLQCQLQLLFLSWNFGHAQPRGTRPASAALQGAGEKTAV